MSFRPKPGHYRSLLLLLLLLSAPPANGVPVNSDKRRVVYTGLADILSKVEGYCVIDENP
jgi:hypothetical protein